MKTKIVVWGENAENEKILLAIELLDRDNKILIHVFPQEVATEEFYQLMLDKWRENHDIVFPENHKTIERPLSVSDSLLPDDIKVERTDIITRAQAEWHFVVLSSKLYETYKSELDELKEKVDKLSAYSENAWGDLVEFWSKVSGQIQEHTLFKEHSTILKERTNILFEKMKELKKEVQRQFESKSAVIASQLSAELAEIEDKISKGLGVRPLFEELKQLQQKYYNAEMTRGDKNKIWSKIDASFKSLKENKGDNKGDVRRGGGEGDRLQGRYDGLINAIKKMEGSVKKDQQEIDFQTKRIAQSEGQLEMQIRQAKSKMVEERIKSKKEKLDDMYKTRTMLESKLESANRKAKKEEAKDQVKSKIASEIKNAEEERTDIGEKLSQAATEINEAKAIKVEEKQSLLASIMGVVEETIEDVVDTAKAIAEVVEDKFEDLKDVVEDKVEVISDKMEEKAYKASESFDEMKDTLEEKFENLSEAVGEKVDEYADKFAKAKESAADKYEEIADIVEEKADNVKEAIKDKVENLTGKQEEE